MSTLILIILAGALFAFGYKCGLEQCDHISRWEEEAREALAAEQKRREEADERAAQLEKMVGMARDMLNTRDKDKGTDEFGDAGLINDLWEFMDGHDTLRADAARLRKALGAVLPDESGRHGGPLIQMVASYEDGTSCNDGYQQEGHKYKINHHDYTRARAALTQKPGGGVLWLVTVRSAGSATPTGIVNSKMNTMSRRAPWSKRP